MGKERACSEEQFFKDVQEHAMTVLQDDGIRRHLCFRKAPPAGSEYWFDLITWPGALCIDGDMGTYVFRRVEDMFEFFRPEKGGLEYFHARGKKLSINPGYWAEKLQATSSNEGLEEFDKDAFVRHVKEEFDSWVESNEPNRDRASAHEIKRFEAKKNSLWNEIEEAVLARVDDGEEFAFAALSDFHSDEVKDFDFTDYFEWNCKDYTFHFIWCCYAVVWGVGQYDAHKQREQQQETEDSSPSPAAEVPRG